MEDPLKLRVSPSENGLSIQARDKINEHLQDSFETLLDYKNQAMRQAKIIDEQKNIIEKLKGKLERVVDEVKEKRTTMNTILNLFNVADQISIDDLKIIIEKWRKRDTIYMSISKAFNKKPDENVDFSNSIIEMLKLINQLEGILHKSSGDIVTTVKEILSNNGQLMDREKELSNALSLNQVNNKEQVESLINEKNVLLDENEKQKNEIKTLKMEQEKWNSLKKTVNDHLGIKNEEFIIISIDKLRNESNILQSIDQKIGCDNESAEETVNSLMSKLEKLENERTLVSKSLGVPVSNIVASVKDLNETKQRLESEINDLKTDNERMKSSILKFESQSRSDKDAINDKDLRIESITKERDQLKTKSREQADQVASLTQANEELSAQLTTTKAQLQNSENLKKILQTEIDNSKQHTNSVVEKLTADNAQKASEISKLSVEISASKRAQNELKEQINTLEDARKSDKDEIEKVKSDNSKLKTELSSKQDENGELKAAVDKLKNEYLEMQKTLEQTKHTLSSLQLEHDDYVKAADENQTRAAKDVGSKITEINSLKCELAEAQRKQLSAETSKQQVESELALNKQHSMEIIDKLKENVTGKTEEISKLNSELITANATIESFQKQLKETESAQQLLQSQYETEKSNSDEKAAKLIADNAEKHKEIATLKTKIADLERENTKAIVKLNTLQAHVEQNTSIQQMMQGEFEASKRHTNEILDKVTKESTEKSNEIANLKLELASIGTKHQTACSQILELTNKLEQIEQQKSSVSLELEETRQKSEKSFSDLTADSQSKVKEIKMLNEKISEQEITISQMATSAQNMKLEINTLYSKLDHKEAHIKQQEQQLQNQKEQITTLLNQMTEDKQNNLKEVQALKKEITLKDQNINQLNNELTSLNDSSQIIANEQASDLQKLTTKNNELAEQIKRVTTELQSSKDQNDELTEESNKKDETISKQQQIIDKQNTLISNNSNEIASLQQKLDKDKVSYEEKIAEIQKEYKAQINELKTQHIKDVALLSQEKQDEISKAHENSQLEMSKLSTSTQQKLDGLIAQSKKVLADKQNEIIELTNKYQDEITQLQRKNQDEITEILNEKQRQELNFAEKEDGLNRQISDLEIENSQLRAKIDAIGKQIADTSRELNEVQNDFMSRSRIYDQSVSYHKEALGKICTTLGMRKSATTAEIVSAVEKLMKNFAKQQTEVCKSLNIPWGSPTKAIKKRIDDLNEQNTTISNIAENLGVQSTPEAIKERVESLEKHVDVLQNKLKRKEKELYDVANRLNVGKISEIPEKLQYIIQENEQLQTEMSNTQLYNRSLCHTLGCDEQDLDKTVEDIYNDKKKLERAQQKLAELVGADEESMDCASVVYERVQDLKKTQDELSSILGTDRISESVASLKRQNDELLTVFDNKDDDETLVYAAGSVKRSLQNLEEENSKMLSQQSQLCEMMNVSTFKDLQRSVLSLQKDNEKLKSKEIENATLREQVADIIDEGGLDSSRNDTIILALQQLKEEKHNLNESLADQTKLISAALGIKGRTTEAMAKGILSLKKKCKANEDTVKRMQDMMFGICRMLNIEFTTEKTTFGEIELAIGSILSSNSLLKDRVGEIVGLSPSLREPKIISQEVKKLFETAKNVEKMRKIVGELEASKQEMQRLVYRPKTTATIQTDPVQNESLPIIQSQAATIRDIESQLREQEREIGHSAEEIDILRSSLNDIYRSLGSHIATPREAIREIGHLKMQNDDLSRSVLEAKNIPISSSALSDFQQAQMASLRATSDRLYNQAKTLKNESISEVTTPTKYSYASRSRTVKTPLQSSSYRERSQASTPSSLRSVQSPTRKTKYL